MSPDDRSLARPSAAARKAPARQLHRKCHVSCLRVVVMADVELGIAEVKSAIAEVELEIENAESKAEAAAVDGNSANSRYWTKEEQQLRTEAEQLRTKRRLLRKELQTLEAAGAASSGLWDDSKWKRTLKAPSTMAQHSELMELQQPEDPFFLMYRPAKARAIPIALMHPLFGRFLDIANGRAGHPTQQDYEMAVGFCATFSRFYSTFSRFNLDEDERTTAVRAVLERALGTSLPRLKIDSPDEQEEKSATDGTAYYDEKEKWAYRYLTVELEVGTGWGDPLAESLGYVWWHTQLRGRTHLLLPALIFEQFGPFMRISGVVNTGEHLASEPLTTAMHMLDLRPHQPHFMHLMALACRSLRETEQALWGGYADGSLQTIDASELPYPLRDASKVPAAAAQEQPLVQRGDVPGTVDEQQRRAEQLPVQLQVSATTVEPGSRQAGGLDMAGTSSKPPTIRIHPHPGVPDKLLYICDRADGSCTVVKFTTTYCLRLHELLSDADLAPKLVDFVHLPGGWLKVEMQFLNNKEWPSFQEVLDEGDESKIELARAAIMPCLAFLHNMPDGPWVWGDARPNNIMLRWLDENAQPEVRFIDFDSSGREGEALYPGFRNPCIPSPPGVASHQPMMCLHDSEILQACIDKAVEQFRPSPARQRSRTASPALPDGASAGLRTIVRPPEEGKQDNPDKRQANSLSSAVIASISHASQPFALPAMCNFGAPQCRVALITESVRLWVTAALDTGKAAMLLERGPK
ncbi:hypothetical protein WJX74_010196 [Apatococcus lobatus]|uniref:Uncharacterized protein n=1 Tax=Apatococcus lobatus TaxID=904363 RepID=A0AAW1R1X0_9CHLO